MNWEKLAKERGEQLASMKPYHWMPKDANPVFSGWYYVQEDCDRRVIGIRYFDDSNDSWWAVSKDAKNDGALVPNCSFKGYLVIPDISDTQRL